MIELFRNLSPFVVVMIAMFAPSSLMALSIFMSVYFRIRDKLMYAMYEIVWFQLIIGLLIILYLSSRDA